MNSLQLRHWGGSHSRGEFARLKGEGWDVFYTDFQGLHILSLRKCCENWRARRTAGNDDCERVLSVRVRCEQQRGHQDELHR